MEQTHAGVEEFQLNLVVFNTEDQLKKMLMQIGLTVDEENKIHDPEGEIIQCSCCEKDIEIKEVGQVMPGSYHIYCKDPVCIFDYFERFA